MAFFGLAASLKSTFIKGRPLQAGGINSFKASFGMFPTRLIMPP